LRVQGLLFQCNQMSADYLFQQDKPYDVSYDTGDKAIQCGRHNDIFKLWLMWRAKVACVCATCARLHVQGTNGFAKQIDRLMQLAAYFTERIRNTAGYELVIDNVCALACVLDRAVCLQPTFLNICFWYVPPSLRQLAESEKMARLDKIAPKIKGRMMQSGTVMVGYQPDQFTHRPNFFRLIISNQAITEADLDFLVDEIVRLAADL
jgi:glutamate decarboxylase